MKPGTFTQLYTHLVFAVKYRECLLQKEQRIMLFSYLSGIVSNLKHKSMIVNGYSDHVHVLFGQNPSVSISDTVSVIKKASSQYINDNKWFKGKFQWQDGYAAFSYGRSQLDEIFKYISNQEIHHQIHKFKDEYVMMLSKAEIEFDERFLFVFFNEYE